MIVISIFILFCAAVEADYRAQKRLQTNITEKAYQPFQPEARSCSLVPAERRIDCLPAFRDGNQSVLLLIQLLLIRLCL